MHSLYRHFDKDGNLLYVGVSINHLARLLQHRVNAHWFKDIATITVEHFETRKECMRAERVAIVTENPAHNLVRYQAGVVAESGSGCSLPAVMELKEVHLNRKSIGALPSAPAGKRDTYYLRSARQNEQVPTGFCLVVTDRGAKTYYLQRRIRGQQRRVFIERDNNITPAHALKLAWMITGQIELGRDPIAERKAARNERRTKTREASR